jgi:TPR repeat protein
MTIGNQINLNAFKEKAEAGDANAQYSMAFIENEYADPIIDDGKRSLAWLEKAAAQGHVNAQLAMGFYFLFKAEREPLMKKWRNHLNGNINMMPLHLGVTLAIATLFEANDDHLAFEWFKKSSAQTNSEGQFWLGYCYYNGIGVEQSYSEAFSEFFKAAGQRMPDAMFWLAHFYFEGIGAPKNDALAFEWLMKSVEGGCDDGYLMLGDLYRQGKCVEQNAELAFQWCEKAAIHNNAQAQHKLAKMYLMGIGVEENYGTAFEWEEKSAENGNKEAREILVHLCLGEGLGYRFGEYGGRKYQIDHDLAFYSFSKAAHYGSTEAYYFLADCYNRGFGVEENSILAFENYKKLVDLEEEHPTNDVLKCAAYFAIANFYKDGKGVERNDVLAKQYFDLADKEKLGDFIFNGIMIMSPDDEYAKDVLPIRVGILNSLGEFDIASNYANKVFDNLSPEENKFRSVYLDLIISKKEISDLNKDLEEKNRQLQEARHELEETMAMFAHKFRSPLDAIIYNTTHDNQPALYTEAAQTMRGLLDVFSIISTDESVLKSRLQQDNQGSCNLLTVFSTTLDMIMLHLLSVSASEKIQQHYMAYAKAQELCDREISYKNWDEDFFELEQKLQGEWQQAYAQLLNESADLAARLLWLEQHFFKLELIGFDSADIHFKEHGITASFLTILLNEVMVNAFKYYSSAEKQPVVLEWVERDGYQVLICRNPSIQDERTMIKGSRKGHTFLSALARKTECQFNKPIPTDNFVIEFSIPNELLLNK